MSKSKPKQQTVVNQPWAPAQDALKSILTGAGDLYQSGGMVVPQQQNLQQTAAGDFIGANPYLQGIFDQGADAIQNRINSQFGLSGRSGSPGHQGVMARELGNFATNLYGGAYQQERANQLAAAGMEQQLLAQNSPLGQLQNYLGIAQPIGALGSQSSQPIYQNQAAGALGGGLLGYGLMGSGLGGLGGAILGGFF